MPFALRLTYLTGLAAILAATLAPAHATSSGTETYADESFGTVNVPGFAATSGDQTLTFEFGPGMNFAPAELVATNFQYTGNWSVDTNALLADPSAYFVGHLGYTYTLSPSAAVTSVSLYNNGTPSTITPNSFFGITLPPTVTSPDDGLLTTIPTTSSITLPFTSVGTSASFDFTYYDPPADATFDVLEGSTTLLAGNFDPNGDFTPTTTAGGVTESFTPNGAPAVPEPSSFALIGLGLLPLVWAVRKRGTGR